MTAFAGTWTLVRLAMRRDRIVLPVWTAVVALFAWLEVDALGAVYSTDQERAAYAATIASSAAGRMFGVVDGPSDGSIVMVKLFGFFAVVFALLSSMLVVRHTRQDEETGRLELLRSGMVGARAPLAGALLLALALNVVLTCVCFAALVGAGGLPVGGSALAAVGWGAIGMSFAVVAAVTSQVAGSARLANGLAGLALGIAVAVHAVGSMQGEVSADGLTVTPSWVSWLSPLGWAQLATPYSTPSWAALAPAAALVVVGALLAFELSARRDFGRGMLRERRLHGHAAPWLGGPLGLAVRLHRTTIVSWTAGIVALGAFGGAFTDSVKGMLAGNAQAERLFAALGGSDVLVQGYLAVMVTYLALLSAAFALQVSLRLRSEERGPGEAVLVAGASRARWMSSHLAVAAVAASVAMVLGGVALVLAARASGASVDSGAIVTGTVAQVPALLVYVGAAALGFGVAPRWGALLGWGVLALSVVVLFASMLDFPQWVLDLSPIEHAPRVPIESVTAGSVLGLLGVAAAATAAGLAAFRRRDVRAAT